MYQRFPFTPGTQPVSTDPTELILNRAWRPALAVIGADGLPAAGNAGNVLRPLTALKLSLAAAADLRCEDRLARAQRA